MKTTLLALLLTASAYAQSVGDVELKNLDITYVELTTEEQMFSTKFRLLVDYGQAAKKDSEKSFGMPMANRSSSTRLPTP